MMSEHEIETLDYPLPEVLEEFTCDEHKKPKEFICDTCQLLLCSICAVEIHRLHEVLHWNNYVRITKLYIYGINLINYLLSYNLSKF